MKANQLQTNNFLQAPNVQFVIPVYKRDDIKSALKVGLILLLDEFGYPPVERDEVYVEIFEQAENFKKNRL